MADPVLHLLAGPNGAGKSKLFAEVIGPATHLELVNADELAARRWPEDAERRSYDAAVIAAERRAELIAARASFVTETVFSHQSKVELVKQARAAGYLVTLHVVLVPEELAVARVAKRVEHGGHAVPEDKVRARFGRLWALVAEAIAVADAAFLYDNSRITPAVRLVATFDHGAPVGATDLPSWAPTALLNLFP
jgi:predicted ABC-type ATPase